MLLLNNFLQRRRQKKKSKTEPVSHDILEKTLLNFIKLKESEVMNVLLEIYSTKENQALQLGFKEPWINMERVDKIESLILIEKNIVSLRKELCNEYMQMSKGKL